MSTFPRHLPLAEVVEFGPFRFDHAERVLTRDGAEIRLPPRVVGVLEFLLERQGKVVSKQALIDGVWGGTAVTDTSLTEAISILRQALGDDAQNPAYLETVHRRGYRFRSAGVPPAGQAASRRLPAAETAAVQPARTPALLIGALILLAIAIVAIALRRKPAPAKPAHVTIATAGELMEWSSLAISPNARDIIYVAKQNGEALLYHRSLDGFESRAIAGTKNAQYPFFSPDGEWIGFVSDGKLMKVKLKGGQPLTLCRGAAFGGATWTRDGSIVFASPAGGLSRVSADGGTPETLTVPDSVAGEVGHVAPQVLPDGTSVLFTIFSTTVHAAKVAVLSLETKQRRVILEHAGGARYVPGGHLIYSSSEGVLVVPFDAAKAKVTGPPADVLRDVMANPFLGVLHLAVADDGTIVYFSGERKDTPVRELVRRDAAGSVTPIPTPQRFYRNLELAPDGARAAVTILQEDRSDVWIADLKSGTLNRLTFAGFNIEPVWSPDGEWVYYASNRLGPYNVFRRRANGQGAEERLLESRQHQYPLHWSPDGKILVIAQASPVTSIDIHLIERTAGGSWSNRPFVRSPNADLIAEVSPDGRWIAYASYEESEWVIYLQDFPQGSGKWQMSTGGGWQPFWSADGATLYYENGDKLVGVPLTFRVGGVERGREITIDAGTFALAQRGAKPGELTIIRMTNKDKEDPKRELRMVTGWAGAVAR
jgi:Tol biopolymer transport system component/DNA-binding winged helix-turn-helix (wHTH) protein